jgi:hypothetical protein
VVRLARSGPREALVQLPETMRPAIGSTAQARTFGGASGSGTLRQLSDAADPATRTFERAMCWPARPPRPRWARPSRSAWAAQGRPALQVPLGAIRDVGKGPGVWVIGRTAPGGHGAR